MESLERSLPRHSAKGSKRSRASSLVGGEARLSIIAEDGFIPTIPDNPRNNRTFSRGWAFGNPPRHSFEKSPPSYSFWDVTGPKGERLADVRNNKYIAKRGGWRRICLIALVVLAALVALAVGLRKHHQRYAILLERLHLDRLLTFSQSTSSTSIHHATSAGEPRISHRQLYDRRLLGDYVDQLHIQCYNLDMLPLSYLLEFALTVTR